MPARGDDAAEIAVLCRFRIDMEGLRVELLRKGDDGVLREGMAAGIARGPDDDVLEILHLPPRYAWFCGRRRYMPLACIVSTTSPFWLRISYRVVTIPRSGFDCDGRTSRTSPFRCSTSSGRTGLTQRSWSTPGEPMLAYWPITLSTSRRIMMPAVCHPEAQRPPNSDCLAASLSRWKGWGS